MTKRRRRLPFFLLAGFLILMVVGIKLGEFPSVLEKAITICLDCIGIG